MTNQNLPKFKAISAIPATKRNLFAKLVSLVFALMFFGMLVMSVYWLIYEKFWTFYVFTFLISGSICFGITRLLHNNYPVHIKILVDEIGVHKTFSGKRNENISILYKDLMNPKGEIKPQNTTFALCLKTEGRNRKVFEIYSLDKSNKIIKNKGFIAGELTTGAFFRNHKKMIAAFLLGTTIFRPDIQIDPALFHYFFIDKKTFEHDAKEQTQTYLYVFAFVFFVVAVLGLILFNLTNS